MGTHELDVLFELEKHTKNTGRYSEVACKVDGKDDPGPVIGTIYVRKPFIEQLGDGNTPAYIRVCVTVWTPPGPDVESDPEVPA